MADIAQILGVGDKKHAAPTTNETFSPGDAANTAAPAPLPPNKATLKLQGKSREVMGLLPSTALQQQQQQHDGTATAQSALDPLQSAPLPPAVPAFPLQKQRLLAHPGEEGAVKVGNRWIKIQVPARKWTWAPFSSSSRTDGALFHHWIRAQVEYPDYPYARFDIHLDPVAYTDQEYQQHLQSSTWTKSETDRLMELVRRLEMRWPVIYDRWLEMMYSNNNEKEDTDHDTKEPAKQVQKTQQQPEKKVEDLQFRFYQVAAVLNQLAVQNEAAAEAQILSSATPNNVSNEEVKAEMEHMLYETAAARQLATMDGAQQPLISCIGTGTSNKVFDLEYERQRRAYLEAQWNRTKEEEKEEKELRQELKQVEAQLRRIKKSGGHIWAARKVGAVSGGGSASSSRANSRSATPIPDSHLLGKSSGSNNNGSADHSLALDEAFASTAPVPVPGTPFLQSARMVPPAAGGSSGLNKTLLQRMDAVLHELKVPLRPLPTKRVCDMYDSVRKDVISLLLLQKNVLQKEGLLQAKRLRLEKLTGNPRVTEESVMGITPPPAPAPAAPPTAAQAPAASSGAPAAGRPKQTAKGAGGKAAAAVSTSKKMGKKAAAAAAAAALEETEGVGKDAAAASASTTAKQVVTGKQATAGKGGKQAKKAAPKRKRKAESGKSPVPPSAAVGGDAKGEAGQKGASQANAADAKPPGKKRRAAPKGS